MKGPGDIRSTAHFARAAQPHGGIIAAEQDVRIEDRKQCGEVTVARGGQKGFEYLPLTGAIGVGNRGSAVSPDRCRFSPLGVGRCPPVSSGSSRHDLHERSMSRPMRVTTVVSHPSRFAISPVSALAALTIQIALINVWNRLNASVRQEAGAAWT